VGCDLLPGSGDSLLSWSALLGIACCSQKNDSRDKKICRTELHLVPSKIRYARGPGTPASVCRNPAG
jgi:hypothetical protein